MELPARITTLVLAAKHHKVLLLGKEYFVFSHLFNKEKVSFLYDSEKPPNYHGLHEDSRQTVI